MAATFSRSSFQILLRSYTRRSGAAPIGIYLYPPQKSPPDRGFAVKVKTILSSPPHPGTWEQKSRQRFGRCLDSHVAETTGRSAKKTQRPIQTQRGHFNCSNSASNLKSTLMSYKEVTKTCTAAWKKTTKQKICIYISVLAIANLCRNHRAQDFTTFFALSFFFFFT